MPYCMSVNCLDPAMEGRDFCVKCTDRFFYSQLPRPAIQSPQAASGRSNESNKDVSSGGDNDYWIAKITHPKRLDPYDAECEDLIEHFEMTFQEGEAFKALWRKGQARIGNGKPGDSPLRNAQKVRHFGARIEAMEERQLECSA